MNPLHLVFLVGSSLLVLVTLFVGTFGLLFCERFVDARTQHRDGPGRAGRIDYFQVWTDFRKVRSKGWDSHASLSGRFRLALAAWTVLPLAFLLVLLSPIVPDSVADAELPILLLLPLIAAGIEAVFMHATVDTKETYEWRKHLLLRIIGASMLFLAAVAVGLHVGGTELAAISALQARIPFFSILSSPGLFLCGIGAFAAIFLFAAESPVETRKELSLHGSLQYLLFFVNKMWIFCLLCFWVFVFFGGFGPPLAKLAFPFKVAGALFAFTLIQVSFPRARSSDAVELSVRWLLRLCLIGFLIEVVWVGVWG